MSGQENETAQEKDVNEVENSEQQTSVADEANNSETDAEISVENESDQGLDIEVLQAQLQKEQEQAQINLDKALRAQAEMENLRKRTTRDIENAHKYALEKFVNELLPIIDSMELGMSASESAENIDDLREGMNLTLKMFATAMEKFGVKTIDPQGEKFNPEQHEAVSMTEMEGFESGTVIT
ncbi:MAG: nucleotide exchange factor GrpE, partial [Proteobacteria bacterium]|nr:nucleotide exchange factor GrpE [Pseudomonadota bacterium]